VQFRKIPLWVGACGQPPRGEERSARSSGGPFGGGVGDSRLRLPSVGWAERPGHTLGGADVYDGEGNAVG